MSEKSTNKYVHYADPLPEQVDFSAFEQLHFDSTPDGSTHLYGITPIDEDDYIRAMGYDPDKRVEEPSTEQSPEVTALNERVAQLEQQLDQERQQHKQEISDLMQKHEQDMAELKQQVDSLTQDLKDLRATVEGKPAQTPPPPEKPDSPEEKAALIQKMGELGIQWPPKKGDDAELKIDSTGITEPGWKVSGVVPPDNPQTIYFEKTQQGNTVKAERDADLYQQDLIQAAESEAALAAAQESSAKPSLKEKYQNLRVKTTQRLAGINSDPQPPGTVETTTVTTETKTKEAKSGSAGKLGAYALVAVGAVLVWELIEHKFLGHSPSREIRQLAQDQALEIKDINNLKAQEAAHHLTEMKAIANHEHHDYLRALHAHKHDLDATNGVLKAVNKSHPGLLDQSGLYGGGNSGYSSGFENLPSSNLNTLNYRGDTIWHDVSSNLKIQLGKTPSTEQTNRATDAVLRANNLSHEAARHLPVGFQFKIPNNLVQLAGR